MGWKLEYECADISSLPLKMIFIVCERGQWENTTCEKFKWCPRSVRADFIHNLAKSMNTMKCDDWYLSFSFTVEMELREQYDGNIKSSKESGCNRYSVGKAHFGSIKQFFLYIIISFRKKWRRHRLLHSPDNLFRFNRSDQRKAGIESLRVSYRNVGLNTFKMIEIEDIK